MEGAGWSNLVANLSTAVWVLAPCGVKEQTMVLLREETACHHSQWQEEEEEEEEKEEEKEEEEEGLDE